MSEPDPSPEESLAHPGALGGRRWARMSIDLTPLRTSRDFRLLWSGQAVSLLGSHITYVAVPYQVYQLTGSSLAVGLLGLCELVPLLVMSFVGGALADATDRRRLFLRTEVALTFVPVVLLGNALLPHPKLWPLYVLAAVMAGLDGLGRPSLWALVPRLVPKEQIPAASALHSLYVNLAAVGGPALGGALIALIGLPGTYAIDAVSFTASLLTVRAMRETPPPEDAPRPSLRSVAEGVRYAVSDKVLLGTYVIDFNAMIFGMPRALFPALAATRYGGGPAVLGLLYGAPYAGALVATLTSGWVSHVRRHGVAITVSVVAWGAAIAAFGLAPSLELAMLALAVAGAADFVSALFRSTIWNQTIPDELRGRLAGIELANVASGPLLGDVEAGFVARVTSPTFSIVSGGIACIAGAVATCLALPAFWRYRSAHGAQPERLGATEPAEAVAS